MISVRSNLSIVLISFSFFILTRLLLQLTLRFEIYSSYKISNGLATERVLSLTSGFFVSFSFSFLLYALTAYLKHRYQSSLNYCLSLRLRFIIFIIIIIKTITATSPRRNSRQLLSPSYLDSSSIAESYLADNLLVIRVFQFRDFDIKTTFSTLLNQLFYLQDVVLERQMITHLSFFQHFCDKPIKHIETVTEVAISYVQLSLIATLLRPLVIAFVECPALCFF